MRTLDIRIKKHEENTKKIINFLKKEKKINEILYPHKRVQKITKIEKILFRFTGLFSVLIKVKIKKSILNFVNSLKLFGIGQSWGGFESLVLYQNHNITRIFKDILNQTII